MPASKNLVGQNFGFLTVLEKTSQRDNCGNVIWLCKCNYCGKEVLKSTKNKKNSKSCGCYQKKKASEVNKQDITGQRFNKLIALYSLNEKDKDGNYYWVCQCDCGNKTLSTVHDLKRGHKNSCGCIKSKGELLIKELLEKNHIKYKEQYTFNDCINPKTNKLLIFESKLIKEPSLWLSSFNSPFLNCEFLKGELIFLSSFSSS